MGSDDEDRPLRRPGGRLCGVHCREGRADAGQAGGTVPGGQRDGLQEGLGRKHSGLTGIISRAVDPLAKDVDAGEVSSIEGAITKSSESKEFGGNEGGTRYRITVANRQVGQQEFRSGRELWEFAPATSPNLWEISPAVISRKW